jgi:hypothetical protein
VLIGQHGIVEGERAVGERQIIAAEARQALDMVAEVVSEDTDGAAHERWCAGRGNHGPSLP